MADSELLVRLDVFLGLVAVAVIVYALDVLADELVVGGIALAVVGVGLYAVWSYASAYLFAAADTDE
ncbi:hypothetical protein [Halobaculum lipolyticum]|uniref:PH regulation protein F n=1 Tax=Halobaculum lipolyticum TaxID=3032001 RepID=A0ABD5WEU1_9EURY|nr:hypothetical protein [Halobaculum sp. DT31]